MVKFTLNIPQDIYDLLREKSFKTHTPMSAIILSALVPPKPISTNGEKEQKFSGVISEPISKPIDNLDLSGEFHPIPK